MSIQTLQNFKPSNSDERTISKWKTRPVNLNDGHHYIKIIQGSDGHDQRLNCIFKIVRYEHGGEKIVFNVKKVKKSLNKLP